MDGDEATTAIQAALKARKLRLSAAERCQRFQEAQSYNPMSKSVASCISGSTTAGRGAYGRPATGCGFCFIKCYSPLSAHGQEL
jgi:hypothetical protein